MEKFAFEEKCYCADAAKRKTKLELQQVQTNNFVLSEMDGLTDQ